MASFLEIYSSCGFCRVILSTLLFLLLFSSVSNLCYELTSFLRAYATVWRWSCDAEQYSVFLLMLFRAIVWNQRNGLFAHILCKACDNQRVSQPACLIFSLNSHGKWAVIQYCLEDHNNYKAFLNSFARNHFTLRGKYFEINIISFISFKTPCNDNCSHFKTAHW